MDITCTCRINLRAYFFLRLICVTGQKYHKLKAKTLDISRRLPTESRYKQIDTLLCGSQFILPKVKQTFKLKFANSNMIYDCINRRILACKSIELDFEVKKLK